MFCEEEPEDIQKMPDQQTTQHSNPRMEHVEPIRKKSSRILIHCDELRIDKIELDDFCVGRVIDDHDYCSLVEIDSDIDSSDLDCDEKIVEIQKTNHESKIPEFDMQQSNETDCHETLKNIDMIDQIQNIDMIDQVHELSLPLDDNLNFVEYSIQENVEIEFDEGVANSVIVEKSGEVPHNPDDDSEVKMGPILENMDLNCGDVVDQSVHEHDYSLSSSIADDSGMESMDSILNESENSFMEGSSICTANKKSSSNSNANLSENCITRTAEPSTVTETQGNNKRKSSVLDADISEDNVESVDDLSTNPAKKSISSRKNRELLLCDESLIIEGDYENSRRVTRQLVKSHVEQPIKLIDVVPGKLVWGYFSTIWWPALIIKAEDVGMLDNPGKVWVYWIGDSQISELAHKNVDSFSNNLEERFDHLVTNSKSKMLNKKQKDGSCFQLIQLLKDRFTAGALVKPYTSWLKKNILPHRDELDELVFHPYPEKYLSCLDDYRKKNSEHTERYLRQQSRERLSKTVESKALPKRVEKLEKPIKEGGVNIMDQKPGMIIWAKMQGYSLWPCVIMDYQHLNRRQPNFAHQWVMWYGDYKFSQVDYRTVLTFPTGMEKMKSKIESMKDELFCKAVLQAFKDYCEPLEYLTELWTLKDVIHIFYDPNGIFKIKRSDLDQPNENDLYSKTIKKQLRKQINREPECEERKQKIIKCKDMQLALTEQVSLELLCITCFRTENLEKHPFFFASMCSECKDDFNPKIFAYGNDGKCFYCALCGGEDYIAMCDGMDCPRVFCTACIKHIICPESYEDILLRHPWYCFFCDPNQMVNSVLKIRKDWRKEMISIYRDNCEDNTRSDLERINCKRKIRVLSLFDGIGTGLVVLKKLNVEIECYYASEIDPDSIQVSFFNHGDEIIQLGDVRDIDEDKIKEIAPIDLLIGGSPCNELSLANPRRRGLDDPEGTGVLFYDYCRIKKLLKKHNKRRHLFWLFENVASMPKKFRMQINEHLGREPQFVDSADFSAQHRPRLYWGNIPWGPYEKIDVILQDMLRKKCNRQALVKKIMTVTTRQNSLNQTKENLKPVLMNGKKDGLWVTELEEIFGFPAHYTDANLQKTRRLQLIGKAWSVQTLTAILRPVFYF
ncbi:hypothetical protein QAD02_009389 [Eretmocerus hayati]|uniref:Uncharacterized protein n=1 Tax=Eretmocerus hayati TaxID=131215 RepID=A0ACC2N9Y6_9HYME|nr:hypothetical protein QAD02_009389 [Eretmocerus hayati]